MILKKTLWPGFSLALVLLIANTSCTEAPPAEDLGIVAPEGFRVELFASNLEGPTQMIHGPDGRIWVAQLAGTESGGTGQIIAIDSSNPIEREILTGGLFKPTGIAVVGSSLWIAAGRDLLQAELSADGRPAKPVAVLRDLPFNGRSNGTLTITPQGLLIFETSGRRRGNLAVEDSASLWSLDPDNPSQPRLLASGLKNAYAHAFDQDGRLWATDVADDPVNGKAPPDELNLIVAGEDYGWPSCYADQQPALNYEGTESYCRETQPAVATFSPRSTPTSVIPSPWEENVLLVALWGPTDPAVVRVYWVENQDGQVSSDEVSPFLTGMGHPQSLLAMEDGTLLVSDFNNGRIYRISLR